MDAGATGHHIHVMEAVPDQIVPKDFPELATLVWNRDPARPVEPEEAFALYERNWRFVDRDALTPREAALIRTLAERFGRGHFLA